MNTVFEVLKSTKQTQISELVGELSTDEHDVLIKYLYKLMQSPQGQSSSGIFLAWFNKTIEAAGTGPITRYLNDRRLV